MKSDKDSREDGSEVGVGVGWNEMSYVTLRDLSEGKEGGARAGEQVATLCRSKLVIEGNLAGEERWIPESVR